MKNGNFSTFETFYMWRFSVIEVLKWGRKKFRDIEQNETKIILDKGMEDSLRSEEDMKQMQKIHRNEKSSSPPHKCHSSSPLRLRSTQASTRLRSRSSSAQALLADFAKTPSYTNLYDAQRVRIRCSIFGVHTRKL